MSRSARRRGQSLVEFGIIALLFTLLLFAVVDFGLLLNDWLSVSSGARLLARDAAVGMTRTDLKNEAEKLVIPGVSADAFAGGFCCDAGAALQVNTTFYNQCTPLVGRCGPVTISELDDRFWSDGVQGGCHASPGSPCLHPSPPRLQGTCPGAPGAPSCPGDTVVVTLTAAGAQVVTPLVRAFFANATTCTSDSAHCYVPISSTVSMRFEGETL
jgi:hypothetical protein